MSRWAEVALGEVLRKSDDWIALDPETEYKEVTVRNRGQGAVLRRVVTGAEVASSRRLRVHARQFIISRIDARHGSSSVIPAGLEGAVVTNDFPVFSCDDQRLVPEYLGWYCKTSQFVDACVAASEGSTNRVRLKEPAFLQIEMPLPPIEEQRRVVRRIEQLAAHCDKADEIRRQSEARLDALMASALHEAWLPSSRWRTARLESVVRLVSGQVDPTALPFSSLPHINGEVMESGTGRLLPGWRLAADDGVTSGKYRFDAGAVLYSKIRPYLRKAVVVPFEGLCSADVYATGWIDPSIIPEFLRYGLVEPGFTTYAVNLSGRTRMPKLNLKQLLAFELRYPSLEKQQAIVRRLDGVAAKAASLRHEVEIATHGSHALLSSGLAEALL